MKTGWMIDANRLLAIAQSAELTQRMLAIDTLEALATLGVIRDNDLDNLILELRLLSKINADFSGYGAYIVRVLTGENAGQMVIGTSDYWPVVADQLRREHGLIWLVMFIQLPDSEDEPEMVAEDWVKYFHNAFSNNPVLDEYGANTGRYRLNERNLRVFAQHLRHMVQTEMQQIKFFCSPMLEMQQEDYRKQLEASLERYGIADPDSQYFSGVYRLPGRSFEDGTARGFGMQMPTSGLGTKYNWTRQIPTGGQENNTGQAEMGGVEQPLQDSETDQPIPPKHWWQWRWPFK